MGFIFALLLMGLPLAAIYIEMLQSQDVKKLGGFDLPAKSGGYTPKWSAGSASRSSTPAAPAVANATATSPVVSTPTPPHSTETAPDI